MIKFVFWLEEDLAQSIPHNNRMTIISNHLKQKCKWLTNKISVQNKQSIQLEGVQVIFLS